jgi:nicotinamide mononucleotide transporter
MNLSAIVQQFLSDLLHTGWLEFIAVFTGIASVWFSRAENIWVYPTGLISTTIYIYLSIVGHLYGEASVNFYYTVMSIYGWVLWSKKDQENHHLLNITYSNSSERKQQLIFFAFFYFAIWLALIIMKDRGIAPGAIPWADGFASATAYTGMWLMARKKVESWYWWIATNIASIPLYFVKHYVFSSVYYLVLLIMAFWGLAEWQKRVKDGKA